MHERHRRADRDDAQYGALQQPALGLRFLGIRRRHRMQPRLREVPPPEPELDYAERHTHAGKREAEVPVDALPRVTADQRSDRGADVNAHVKDREARVAAQVCGSIELADDRADVGLEQARPAYHDTQARIEDAHV